MNASETPFDAAWWGPGLPGLRPRVGTYGRYGYEPLAPPPDVRFDGTFQWLHPEPRRTNSIVENDRCNVAAAFADLTRFCAAHAVNLPAPFHLFYRDLSLPKRIRSCTACFIDLATDVVPSPKGDGSLIRFLSDQQGCVFWYLFLPPGRHDHCVVASPDYFGSAAAEVDPEAEPPNPDSLVYCAPTFEAFVFRFWIENEYWYAFHRPRSLSPTARRHLQAYGWTPPTPPPTGSSWLRRLLGR